MDLNSGSTEFPETLVGTFGEREKNPDGLKCFALSSWKMGFLLAGIGNGSGKQEFRVTYVCVGLRWVCGI